MRVHRAFLVNLRKIESKKGNTLGYRLKLGGSDIEIPVSRNNTKNFDYKMKQFR
jgi:DNA-binding LytR/AlgR family response regulator